MAERAAYQGNSCPTTLTMDTLINYHPKNWNPTSRNGQRRYYCPIHKGDRQRSFSLYDKNNRFKCHNCGAWGYIKDSQGVKTKPASVTLIPTSVDNNINVAKELLKYQENLTVGSLGNQYLNHRGISLDTAKKYGMGFAPAGTWCNRRMRHWKYGHIVVPHTDIAGKLVSLYARGIWADGMNKHSHLPGSKAIFNAQALLQDTVYITEGVFDALSLIESGFPNTVALFGIDGLRVNWIRSKTVVFAMDQDEAGQSWYALADELYLNGINIKWLETEVYRGSKDLNECLMKYGSIDIDESEGVVVMPDDNNKMIGQNDTNKTMEAPITPDKQTDEYDYTVDLRSDDLIEDSIIYKKLLLLAAKKDTELLHVLHGMRGAGLRIAKQEGLYKLVPLIDENLGFSSNAYYMELRDKYLMPYVEEVKYLLNQLIIEQLVPIDVLI